MDERQVDGLLFVVGGFVDADAGSGGDFAGGDFEFLVDHGNYERLGIVVEVRGGQGHVIRSHRREA